MRWGVFVAAGALSLVPAVAAPAAVRLPAVFSDNLVLQQGVPVPVWGWAEPGEQVRVTCRDREAAATADASGRWRVKLPALQPGPKTRLEIRGNNAITIENVLVGEVWLCSGQSNMAMPVSRAANAEVAQQQANHSEIRFFQVASSHAATPQDDCEGRWVACSPKTVGRFSAAGYFFAEDLHRRLKMPVGMLQAAVGGTAAEAWASRRSFESDPAFRPLLAATDEVVEDFPAAVSAYEQQLADWRATLKTANQASGRRPRPPQPAYKNLPTLLFNGKIAPLVPYAIRGAIWYQGENNARGRRAYDYRRLLPLLITGWREAWGQGDFPFIAVQLPGYRQPPEEPGESDWAVIRESFVEALACPQTGIAVTIDLGEADDIHPRRKQEVGHRLAQWARAEVYDEPIVCCGPLFEAARLMGNRCIIRFDHAAEGLVAGDGEPLRQFAIAGADRRFVWAEARIEGKDTVVVASPAVPEPVAVRYAWADNPAGCNLFSDAGLPASPFRTDDWPVIAAE